MTKHLDYWGTSLEVGDIVLGATPRKDHFRLNEFDVCIITGKTKSMVKVHKLGSNRADVNLLNVAILKRIEERYGRPMGSSHPCNFIKIRETGLNDVEIKEALDKGVQRLNYTGNLNTTKFSPFLP